MNWRVVWRFVSTELGVLFAAMDSVKLMLMWSVHSLVTLLIVSIYIIIQCFNYDCL